MRGKRLGLLVLVLLVLVPATALAKKDKGKPGDDKKDEETWDVSNPPGEWRTIAIDTTETTWSDVDVSPDGTTVVFDMLGDIYSVPISGGDATALTEGIEWNFQPRYSPDGSRIAFVSDRAGGDNLWVMNADGSEPRAVTEEKMNLVHNPSWSPDGEYIVAKKGFTSTRSIPAGEIWLFHLGGGGGLQITERPLKDKDQKTMAEPVFSPDGRYIYYSQDTTPGARWQYNKDSTGQIFVVQRFDREKSETEVYASGAGGAVRPTPSPDGKHLAFVKRLPGLQSALYLKDLASGKEWAVYDRLDRDLQETNGSQGNTPAFAWTPDSKSIVFWAGGKIRRLDVATREAQVIPVRVKTERKITPALRFPVEVAPDAVRTRMIRWAQMSPAGGTVLFQALGHLYLADADGGNPRRVTSQSDHFEFHPSFSRDGKWIVYVSWDDQDLGAVRVAPAGGGPGRPITTEPGHYLEPRFSPSGEKVVYRKITGGYLLSPVWSENPGVYVVPTAGGEPVRVSKTGFDAHFGAAGDRVFFSADFDDTKLALRSVDLDGHEERTHIEGAEVTEFRVSPDGRWVAFTEQYNAFVAPFTATGRPIDMSSEMKSVPVKQVSKRSGEFLHWAAASDRLHWAHGATLFTRDLRDAFAFLEGAPDELPEPVETGIDLGFEVEADRPEGTVALVGGRVVTMRDAGERREVIDGGVVLVDGNRIAAVGTADEVSVPDGATIIDVAGKTVIPGLVDAHAHGAQARQELTPEQNWQQFSNLAFGVTTVHDPSNDTSSIFAAAEMQRAGRIVGPRIFSTGTILYGAEAPGYTARIETLEDATFHVRRLKDVGAISVKSYQQPRRDQRQKVITAARELGIMVVPEGGAKFQHNMNEIVERRPPALVADRGRLHAHVQRGVRRSVRRALLVRAHRRLGERAAHALQPAFHHRAALDAPAEGAGGALQPHPGGRLRQAAPRPRRLRADRRPRPEGRPRRPLGDVDDEPGRLHALGGDPLGDDPGRLVSGPRRRHRVDRAGQAGRPGGHRREPAGGPPPIGARDAHHGQRPSLRDGDDEPDLARPRGAPGLLLREGGWRHHPPGDGRVAAPASGALRVGPLTRLAAGRCPGKTGGASRTVLTGPALRP
jgi:Tol biopolymer transport system component